MLFNSKPKILGEFTPATNSDFIDYDVLETIDEFRTVVASERDINLSLIGFKDEFKMADHIKYVQVLTEEMQSKLAPQEVLEILKLEKFLQKSRLSFTINDNLDFYFR